jgi:hypothetical protein
VCGEDVSRGALACPECGADHKSGWREDAETADALGGMGEEFDYDDFVRKEFNTSIKPAGIPTVWWITALSLLVVLALLYFFSR